jgi:hypothetical protein
LVEKLAFGLDLARNIFLLSDGNDGKGQDKNKNVQYHRQRAWKGMLSNPINCHASNSHMVKRNLNLY